MDDVEEVAEPKVLSVLNEGQQRAMAEIMEAAEPGNRHLLTGWAGSGKTYLVSALVREFLERKKSVVVCAPTHKAVQVIAWKLFQAGVDGVEAKTLHSLLSLRPKAQGDRQIFVRQPNAKPVKFDVVIIDESSMNPAELMVYVRRFLPMSFVLFVADEAQLPPVGEERSEAFEVKSRSHLDEIVRQSADNPIIQASAIIRASQDAIRDGGVMDWSWCRPVRNGDIGVFAPSRGEIDGWLRKAFTSAAFAEDNDNFRYLAWTNARVAEINAKIRRWMLGTSPATPFVAGETALIRSPLVVEDTILIATNEEVKVEKIEAAAYLGVSAWRMKVRTQSGIDHEIHLPRDLDEYRIRLGTLADAAKGDEGTWQEYHDFKAAFVQAQQCMAMTVHNSQGGTFRFAFMDVSDIRKRMRDNPLECAKLLYTGATRASQGLILVGV